MTIEKKVNQILEAIDEVEKDIETLKNNIEQAKKYLTETKLEDIDTRFFNEEIDIERGLKHIELF